MAKKKKPRDLHGRERQQAIRLALRESQQLIHQLASTLGALAPMLLDGRAATARDLLIKNVHETNQILDGASGTVYGLRSFLQQPVDDIPAYSHGYRIVQQWVVYREQERWFITRWLRTLFRWMTFPFYALYRAVDDWRFRRMLKRRQRWLDSRRAEVAPAAETTEEQDGEESREVEEG